MLEGETLLRAVAVGIGGTVVLDLWAILLEKTAGIAATNWAMVGRWAGHLPQGRFIHPSIAAATPVPGEGAIGWAVHYFTGIVYGVLLIGLCGETWLNAPTLAPPVLLAIVLLVAPFFILQPGMGLGVAACKTPKPWAARLKSLMAHTAFGIGMYLTAWLV